MHISYWLPGYTPNFLNDVKYMHLYYLLSFFCGVWFRFPTTLTVQNGGITASKNTVTLTWKSLPAKPHHLHLQEQLQPAAAAGVACKINTNRSWRLYLPSEPGEEMQTGSSAFLPLFLIFTVGSGTNNIKRILSRQNLRLNHKVELVEQLLDWLMAPCLC